MNDDLKLALRDANPVPEHPCYPELELRHQIASITAKTDVTPDLEPARRRRPARAATTAIAFVGVAAIGVGTAAASGWLTPQARDAFDSPATRAQLIQQFGARADLDRARPQATLPGPDGTTLSLWTVPVTQQGSCMAILSTVSSAPLPNSAGRANTPSVTCGHTSGSDGAGIAGDWRSPKTGIEYYSWGGRLDAKAVRAEIRTADGRALPSAAANGYFLSGPIPVAQLQCSTLVSFNSAGQQLERRYLTDDCPTDPAVSTSPPPLPPRDLKTPVSVAWHDGYGYSNTVGLSLNALIRQPDRKAAHLEPGHVLITVQLQFYQATGYPASFPRGASFDLLYGPDHLAAPTDTGHDNDPDLNGFAAASDDRAILPQQSFDVPVDQLDNLQVRLNSDGTIPAVTFLDAQKAL